MEENLNKKVKNHKNSKLIIFLAIVLIVSLIGVGYFTYSLSAKEELKFNLEVYKEENGKICLIKNDNCSDLAYNIPTKINNANILAVDSDNLFILYDDNGLNIYNTKTSEINNITLKNTYSNYRLYTTNAKEKVSAIIYQNGSYDEYYNVLTNQKLLENKYHWLRYRDENYVEGRIDISEERDARIDLINLSNQNVILSNTMKEKGYINSYNLKRFGSKYYIYSYCECDVPGVKFYTDDGKDLFSPYNVVTPYSFSDTGNLFVAQNDKVLTYDIDGNLLKTSKKYNNILRLTSKYIISIDNNKFLNIDNVESEKNVFNYKLNDKYQNYILGNTSDENKYDLFGCVDKNYEGYNCSDSILYELDLDTLSLNKKDS